MDRYFLTFFALVICLTGCTDTWNDPYPSDAPDANTLYTAFTQRPKHLDPVQSYTEDEAVFLYQIVEPPLQYHYLRRPHELIPATATRVPEPVFYDQKGNRLPQNISPDRVAYSVYDIKIKPGIYYQPHPAFAKKSDGTYLYYPLAQADIITKRSLTDFAETGTQELIANDYIYQIKRLAHPRLHSPILEQMSAYIVGLGDYAKKLQSINKTLTPDTWMDLDQYALEGVELIDRYTYRIKIHGVYPQMKFWLAMHFFSPVPKTVERFFSQPGMKAHNLSLDYYPVGTGPYMMLENNPDRKIVLVRNPNFREEFFPTDGEAGDKEAGLLTDAGRRLPFIDRIVYTREKESIPYWNKFLQGYFDASGVSSSSFDQVIMLDSAGSANLSPQMQQRGIQLLTATLPSIYYMGFNFLDPVIGGYDERNRKLRLAISIAYNQEEYNAIFLNGRAMSAQGPIPPGIFGYRTGKGGINPFVFDWINGQPKRKSLQEAKQLLTEAGYPNGRDAKTGKPLVLNLDTTGGGVADKSRIDWTIKQFAKLNIQLNIRSSDFNRFQDKLLSGNFQIFELGWNTDYPDPENMLFLFHGKQARVFSQGENTANYQNPRFDAAFEKMKRMPNSPERQALIDDIVTLLRHDAPWSWGFHIKSYTLIQPWLFNRKPGSVTPNTVKYQRIDPVMRATLRQQWNQPARLPLAFFVVGLVAIVLLGWRFFSVRGSFKPLAADEKLPPSQPSKDL